MTDLPSGLRVVLLYIVLSSNDISEPGTIDALHSKSIELFKGKMKFTDPVPQTVPKPNKKTQI